MAQLLYAVANASSVPAKLASTEYPGDNMTLPGSAVSHTGGSDDNYIKIPDCSGPQYFEAHHIGITANDGSWTVALWNNDDEEHLLYWAPVLDYSQGQPVAGTDQYGDCAIMITLSGGTPKVFANQWT